MASLQCHKPAHETCETKCHESNSLSHKISEMAGKVFKGHHQGSQGQCHGQTPVLHPSNQGHAYGHGQSTHGVSQSHGHHALGHSHSTGSHGHSTSHGKSEKKMKNKCENSKKKEKGHCKNKHRDGNKSCGDSSDSGDSD